MFAEWNSWRSTENGIVISVGKMKVEGEEQSCPVHRYPKRILVLENGDCNIQCWTLEGHSREWCSLDGWDPHVLLPSYPVSLLLKHLCLPFYRCHCIRGWHCQMTDIVRTRLSSHPLYSVSRDDMYELCSLWKGTKKKNHWKIVGSGFCILSSSGRALERRWHLDWDLKDE